MKSLCNYLLFLTLLTLVVLSDLIFLDLGLTAAIGDEACFLDFDFNLVLVLVVGSCPYSLNFIMNSCHLFL